MFCCCFFAHPESDDQSPEWQNAVVSDVKLITYIICTGLRTVQNCFIKPTKGLWKRIHLVTKATKYYWKLYPNPMSEYMSHYQITERKIVYIMAFQRFVLCIFRLTTVTIWAVIFLIRRYIDCKKGQNIVFGHCLFSWMTTKVSESMVWYNHSTALSSEIRQSSF